jgi:aldehyde:ferredoxin oxidoreductase
LTFGWIGRALNVDLDSGKTKTSQIDKSLLKKFLGGRGLASYYLFKELNEKTEPLSPENILLFSAGPLAGTVWPTSSRVTVAAKSPLTNGLGYANAGGFFGPELKFAGYDLVHISGRAREPVYLQIENENVNFKSASHIWHKTTSETIETVQREFNSCRVACIGPAGENLVRIASIITDRERAAARCGLGAVMGSKNLKAVAVRGKKKVDTANPEEFHGLCSKALKRWSPENPQLKGLSNYGTLWLIATKNETGDLPAKNHQTARFPWTERISGETVRKKYFVKAETCFACPIHCRAYARATEGKYAPLMSTRPEYETIDSFGPMCWVADFSAIMKANELCNELGLDTISAGVTVAFAMELYEKGLITKKETGVPLEWGNDESMLEIIKMIANRRGFGDVLADGTARAAERIGRQADKFAMHVKKMETPRQEPRTLKAFALGHAVSNRGADHLYALPTIDSARKADVATHIFPEKPLDEILDTKNPAYKPDIVAFTENYCAITDALGVCKFSTAETYVFMPSDFAKALTALTGKGFTEKTLMDCGERIVNLERCFNVREGFSRKDDELPERFLSEPFESSVVELDKMLSRYYKLRGWSEDGIPKKETLERLGLQVCEPLKI